LIVLLLIDTWYYGKLTFTPLNFVLANVSVSSYYGVNRWSFYLVEALPLLTTTALPFVIHGAYLANSACDRAERTRYTTLFGVVAGTIAVYSFGPHKEWRFIHPLLPLLHVCAAKSLHDLAVRAPRTPTRSLPIRRSHIALLLLNVPAILYVLFFHGQAQVVVMHHLRSIPPAELDSVGFLMPCHSTPWQSHLHRPNLASTGKMWALTCEPPLKYVACPECQTLI
jgi:phosphatidylinositol glycan class B